MKSIRISATAAVPALMPATKEPLACWTERQNCCGTTIAMGGLGSDAAIEAADVVLMTDEPSKLVDAIDVAKATKRIVMQNIIIALGIKSVFLILGALGIAGMWEAVFGDVGVTIIAVLNAMRILKK